MLGILKQQKFGKNFLATNDYFFLEIKRKGGQGRANDRGYDAVMIDPSFMSKGPSSNHQRAGKLLKQLHN